MKVVDMRFNDTYSVFFKFLKILDFIKDKKNRFVEILGVKKLKILKFRDIHFVARVILHLSWSFCALCFKTLFCGEFLNPRTDGGAISAPPEVFS